MTTNLVTNRIIKENLRINHGVSASPFGDCFVAFNDNLIIKIAFLPKKSDLELVKSELLSQIKPNSLSQNYAGAKKIISDIFNQKSAKYSLNLDGTDFQIKVWQALMKIPKGSTACYEDIAKAIGKPKAVRAVGTAVSKNKIAFLIPCHRIIRKNGDIGQYRWGATIKEKILKLEQQ